MSRSKRKINIIWDFLFPSLIILVIQAVLLILTLFSRENIMCFYIFLCLLLVLSAGHILLIIYKFCSFIKTINAIAKKVKSSDFNASLAMSRSGIHDIEQFEKCLNLLSNEHFSTSDTLGNVLDNIHLDIATFNYSDEGNTVYCSSSIQKFISIPEVTSSSILLDKNVFLDQFKIITSQPFRDYPDVYQITKESWVRIFIEKKGNNNYGIVIDYTSEIEKQIRLEFERDSDLLTELSTRRYFEKTVGNELAKVKNAALIMCDLDNLKAINDRYGHSSGDRYIRSFSDLLRHFATDDIILCRRSGDEFFIYVPNIKEKTDVITYTQKMIDYAKLNPIKINESTQIPISFSAGIAFYPENGRTLEKLMHHSDLAMLSVKNREKGNVNVYDSKDLKKK